MATTRRMCLRKLGDKCCRCGYRDLRALQFDHINGDGFKIRKTGPNGKYTPGLEWNKRIIAAYDCGALAERYQLLCANCNQIKRREQGETRQHSLHDEVSEFDIEDDQYNIFE